MEWLSTALAVAGGLAVVVSAVMVGKGRSKDEAIIAQGSTIEALRAQVSSIEEQRQADERRCEQQIAELRGRVDALAEQQSDVLTALLAPRIVDGLIAAMQGGRIRFERREGDRDGI